MRRALPSHGITTSEVKGWFGQRATARLSEAQCRAIAHKLNSYWWPGDPVEPSAQALQEPDRYWDFCAASKAVNVLLGAMPAMKTYWQSLTWASKTQGGYPATLALERALQNAVPFIEWPFGRYRPTTGRKRRKEWQVPSVLLAKIFIEAMVASHGKPSLARKAVLVRAIHAALGRMGYKLNVGTSGVSAYLTRWDKQYGLLHHRKRG